MSKKNELLRSLIKNEQIPIETLIIGTIPNWLNGTLFRNGPGRYTYGNKSYEHLFDGHACVHKFKIESSKIIYSNKFLNTCSYTKSLNENRLYAVFGTVDVCSNIFERFKILFNWPDTLDNVNVSLVPFSNDHLYALTEINVMYEICPFSLNIINKIDITKYMNSISTTLAHPHYLQDGSWLTLGMNTKSLIPYYEFIKYKNENNKNLCEQVELIASVPSSHLFSLSYFHSFAITQNYIIFLEQCLKLDLKYLLSGLITNKAFSAALIKDENLMTRIHIINRNNGQILTQKFYTDPLIVFHHINSYEIYNSENDSFEIITDICAYDPKYFDIKKLTCENVYTERLMEDLCIKSIARRIKIPISLFFDINELEKEIYCPIYDLNSNVSFELPVINYYNYNGLKYNYVYGANYYKLPYSIVKLNVDEPDQVIEYKYGLNGEKCLPSEPIFVEKPNAVREDDGVLLVMVLSDSNDFLSILDAKNLNEIARAVMPEHVKGAFTFHGFFASKNKFEKLN